MYSLKHQRVQARVFAECEMDENSLTPKAFDSLMKNLCVGPTIEDVLLKFTF